MESAGFDRHPKEYRSAAALEAIEARAHCAHGAR
jgi:hypothetical protein